MNLHAMCPVHGDQQITSLGAETVTLECGAVSNPDGWRHPNPDAADVIRRIAGGEQS